VERIVEGEVVRSGPAEADDLDERERLAVPL
jgi:hypothetical protein